MEFDQTHPGSHDWSFPSPMATPTDPTFASNVFQTPKTSTFPSHFQDAFSTPQMLAYTTPHQHHYPMMTPIQGHNIPFETLPSNFYSHSQARPLPQTQATGQAAYILGHTSQQSAMLSPNNPGGLHKHQFQPSTLAGLDQSQMQTPPPTRGSSHKMAPAGRAVAFGTPSTIASRRFMSPQQTLPSNAPSLEQRPAPFPSLQFSPTTDQFTNMGPATAPAGTQMTNLWHLAPTPVPSGQGLIFEDPFASGGHQVPEWSPNPNLMPSGNLQNVAFDTPAMHSFTMQPLHPRPASAGPAPQYTGTDAMTAITATAAGVDPALLYSSPARPVMRSNARTGRPRSAQTKLGPSHEEDAFSGPTRPTTAISEVTVPSRNITSLRRSNTTGTTRPASAHRAVSASESLSRSNSITQIPRTVSPLKRVGRTPLGSISELPKTRQKASVVLTVDENGRARAVKQPVDETPTKSVRDRYPGLFDSDTSEDESDESEDPPSRAPSFSFSRNDDRRTKAARLDTPVENLEGLSIPRSSSASSMRVSPSRAAVAAAAQLRRQGSVRKATPSRNASKRNASSSSTIDTCPMDTSFEQAATGAEATPDNLRTVQNDRGNANMPSAGGSVRRTSRKPQEPQNSLDAHNRRWSMMAFDDQPALDQSLASGTTSSIAGNKRDRRLR